MSTQQPFKFRHLDAIVGAFVLASVGIVIAALALIGSARQWFTRATEVTASTPLARPGEGEFYEELAESLKPGTPVEMGGRAVGAIIAAEYRDNALRLRLSVADRALALLHHGIPGPGGRSGDARLAISAPLAPFMGQPGVVLKPGSAGATGWLTDEWHRNQSILIIPPKDTAAIAKKVLLAVEENLGPMMAGVTGLVTETRALVEEVRAQRLPQQAGELLAGMRERQVPQRLDALLARIETVATAAEAIAGDARRISGGLAEGRGLAGRALADDRLAADLTAIVADLRAITGELRSAAPTAPGLAEGAATLLDEVQRLVDGLNRHWLLKGYTEPGDGGRIAPPGIVEPPEVLP